MNHNNSKHSEGRRKDGNRFCFVYLLFRPSILNIFSCVSTNGVIFQGSCITNVLFCYLFVMFRLFQSIFLFRLSSSIFSCFLNTRVKMNDIIFQVSCITVLLPPHVLMMIYVNGTAGHTENIPTYIHTYIHTQVHIQQLYTQINHF